jgi:predicted transcriptional regulator
MAKTESTTINVVVPIELRQDLEKIAAAEERTLSWIVRKALQEFVEKKEN